MCSKKFKHEIPPGIEKKSFGYVFRYALAEGVGRRPGDRWLESEIVSELNTTDKTVRSWRKDERIISSTNLGLLMDVILAEEFYSDEWKAVFEKAKENTQKIKNEGADISLPVDDNTDEIVENEKVFINKIVTVCRRSEHSVPLLIGPSYLDIKIAPVYTELLEPSVEHSNIKQPLMQLGGSSIFVGRWLSSLFSMKSDLLTSVPSGDDALSNELKRTYQKEDWIEKRYEIDFTTFPPVTFVLEQSRNNSTTMFTYRPREGMLSWEEINECLDSNMVGRIIHISGFMKTDLHIDLDKNLRLISDNNLIIMDHGRFSPFEKEIGHQHEILKSISFKYIDIHIVSIGEFLGLHSTNENQYKIAEGTRINDMVTRIVRERRDSICNVTFIRGYDYINRKHYCFLIYFGEVINVMDALPKNLKGPVEYTYSRNIFNSVLLHYLLTNDLEESTNFRIALEGFAKGAIELLSSGPRLR